MTTAKPKGGKKAAALNDALIVDKAKARAGEAVPVVVGASQRGDAPPAPPAAPEPAPAPAPAASDDGDELIAYGFKLPRRFVQEFRTYAFMTGRKNNKLLFDAFAALKEKEQGG